MNDGVRAAEVLLEAAQLNRDDSLLSGSLLCFPDYGQVVATGDLHGHRRNFERLQSYCDLEHAGARHVVIHEIIHRDPETLADSDTSHEVLLAAAQWKCDFPDQVHFLQSNHELAQIHRHEITKNGRVVTVAFEEGVAAAYSQDADRVIEAICTLIASYPLAGRTANRVFLSHSLPGPHDLARFDAAVLSRVPTREDLSEQGSAHMLVWGRYHTAPALTALAEMLDVDCFVCGHQPQESGYDVLHERMIILASDHNHGVFLPIDLNKPVTVNGLCRQIRPLAGVA